MRSSPSSLRDGASRSPAWGAWLFRHRGEVALLPIGIALLAANPNPLGVALGAGLMAPGEALRLWAAGHLGGTVRSRTPQAARLVTGGPYGHARHPIYLGNLLLTLGYGAMTGAGWPWFPLLVGAGFLLVYRGHARREETALAAAFPEAHRAYRKAVPAWGWRVRRLPPAPGETRGPWRAALALRTEAWTLHAELWLLALLWLRTRFLPGL